MDLRSNRIGLERERMANSWMLSSMLAAAYQTASPSIDVRNFKIHLNTVLTGVGCLAEERTESYCEPFSRTRSWLDGSGARREGCRN